MSDVLTLGEATVSMRSAGPIRLGGELRASPAGAEASVAIGLSRLGHDAAWVGRVGADEPGELVLHSLRAEGVDVSSAVCDPAAPTGLLLLERRLPGVSRVQYYRSGSAGSRLGPDDLEPALTRGARLLHLTGITPALGESPRAAVHAALEHARSAGWTVCFDVNHRAALWSADDARAALTPLARLADVVVGSPDELELVGGAAALLGVGVREVVTTAGARGASARTADGRWTAAGHRIEVVDPVGAGDAFTAGYLSALLDGLPVPDRLARGNLAGACAVGTPGDWEGLPRRDELELLTAAEGTVLR
jgi:2-dehydro-3-deoxygluconokinase